MVHFAGLNKCEKYSYSTCSGTYSYIVHELICLTAFMKSVCVCSLSHVCLFAIPETVACQAPLSMRFSRQGIFQIQESNPCLLHCRQILYHLSHQGSPFKCYRGHIKKSKKKLVKSIYQHILFHLICSKYCHSNMQSI